MSDQQTTEDPMRELLQERRAKLLREVDDINVRISEIDTWLNQLTDGRTRAGKALAQRRKGNTAPAQFTPKDTQPGPYDDSVSLDEAQGVLTP